jgi:hypothetical protein
MRSYEDGSQFAHTSAMIAPATIRSELSRATIQARSNREADIDPDFIRFGYSMRRSGTSKALRMSMETA